MTMDLIVWRHAEAEEEATGGDDLQRPLTSRGEKQAARIAGWLDRHLPDATRILCSPAVRCEQTALALGRKYKVRPELAPGAAVADLLEAAGWPGSRQPVLIVGHQPVLGQLLAQVLAMPSAGNAVRKGGVWWVRSREREGQGETIVLAVQSPETL